MVGELKLTKIVCQDYDHAEYVYEYRGYEIIEDWLKEDDCTHHVCEIYLNGKYIDRTVYEIIDRACEKIDKLLEGK